MSALRTLLWLVALWYATIPVFWIVAHGRAERLRRLRGSPLLLLGAMWLLVLVAAGFLTASYRHHLLYETPLAWLGGAPLIALAVYMYHRVHGYMTSQQIIGRAELRAHEHEQRLVTTGLHARMRHPLYVAHLCMLLGMAVGSGMTVLYSLLAFAVLTGRVMILLEERELEQRFGDEFRDYRRRVPALLPRRRM